LLKNKQITKTVDDIKNNLDLLIYNNEKLNNEKVTNSFNKLLEMENIIDDNSNQEFKFSRIDEQYDTSILLDNCNKNYVEEQDLNLTDIINAENLENKDF
jgi:hypothetical protein